MSVAAPHAALDTALASAGLFVMGASETHILVGAGPRMWPVFTAAPEYRDGAPHPLDRWSKRVMGRIAAPRGWDMVFPSDGPPYAPFMAWAKATGRFRDSPVGMLVHDTAGLMISIRGAFVTPGPAPALDVPSPCESCPDMPCTAACPVDALSAARGYDVAACRSYLDTVAGQDCLDRGCKARRACPVSAAFGREAAQSAFHMASFHPR